MDYYKRKDEAMVFVKKLLIEGRNEDYIASQLFMLFSLGRTFLKKVKDAMLQIELEQRRNEKEIKNVLRSEHVPGSKEDKAEAEAFLNGISQ